MAFDLHIGYHKIQNIFKVIFKSFALKVTFARNLDKK